jgi:subtilisin-like proprotein convertase family protein
MLNRAQMKMLRMAILSFAIASAGNLLFAQGITNTFSLSPNAQVPDANPTGWQSQVPVSGIAGSISDVQITLDISGGYNGDLYAFVSSPGGQLSILLNRPGVTAGNPFGYSDSGLSISMDSSAASNVHTYGLSYSLNGNGQVTGFWQADGRNIDPQSDGATFDSTTSTAGLYVFNGLTRSGVNGNWTFFIADCAGGGGAPTINSVELQITSIPEPGGLSLLVCGAVLVLLKLRSRSV